MVRKSNNLQFRNSTMLGAFIPPIMLFLILVAAIYFYYDKFGDPSSARDSAISDCVRGRTRLSNSSVVREQATWECVRATSPESGR